MSVGDEHLAATEADRGQQLFQEPAGGSNDGPRLLVLVEAGGLAHKHDLGILGSLTGDGVSAGAAEVAVGTGGNLLVKGGQGRHFLTGKK